MILVLLVLKVVIQLGVDGGLQVEGGGKTSVPLFECANAIGHNSDGLGSPGSLWGGGWSLSESASIVKQMNDEAKAGIGSQMNAVGLELGGWEAVEEMEVGRSLSRDHGGKLDQDLRESDRVPVRSNTVHGGSHHDLGRLT